MKTPSRHSGLCWDGRKSVIGIIKISQKSGICELDGEALVNQVSRMELGYQGIFK